MFREALHRCAWDCYDHLGRLVAFNAIICLTLGTCGVFGFLFFLQALTTLNSAGKMLLLFATFAVPIPVAMTLWFGPLMHFAGLVSREKDPSFREFLRGIRATPPAAIAYVWIACSVAGLLVVNIWFYLAGGLFPAGSEWLGWLLAGVAFWFLVAWYAAMTIGIPLVFRQQTRALPAIRLSIGLLLLHPKSVLGSAAFIASFWIIGGYLKGAGIILFAFSMTGMLMNSMIDVMKDREIEAAEKANPPAPPTNWQEANEQDLARERKRMSGERYRRTFRDLMRPWEG